MRDEVANQASSLSKGMIDPIHRASREKTWDECGIEEKVERLRRAMRDQKHMVDAAWRTANEAHNLAHGHQHNNVTGEVLKSAGGHGGMAGAEAMGRSFDPLA